MKFFLKRSLLLIPTLWGVVTIVFFLIHFIPGDPVEIMLGENAVQSNKAELRRELGLDKPLGEQYVNYLINLLKGDMGKSIFHREAVSKIIFQRFPATLLLSIYSMIIAILIAFPAGLISAVKKYSVWDNSMAVISLLGVSLPNFFLGPLLIYFFSLKLGIFPVSGMGDWRSYILPSITLGTALAAILSRMIRSSLLDTMDELYITTAKAKGLSKGRILFIHGLRNALIPVVTIMGLQFGALLSGAIITETVFSWPGIGRLLIEAIQTRDYPVVQGVVLTIAVSYIIVNTFVDLLYGLIDPRIRVK